MCCMICYTNVSWSVSTCSITLFCVLHGELHSMLHKRYVECSLGLHCMLCDVVHDGVLHDVVQVAGQSADKIFTA